MGVLWREPGGIGRFEWKRTLLLEEKQIALVERNTVLRKRHEKVVVAFNTIEKRN